MTSLNYFPFPLSLYLLVYSATPPVQTVSIRSFTYQYIRLYHQYKLFPFAHLPTKTFGYITSTNCFHSPIYLLIHSAISPVQTVSIRPFTYQYIQLHHQCQTISTRLPAPHLWFLYTSCAPLWIVEQTGVYGVKVILDNILFKMKKETFIIMLGNNRSQTLNYSTNIADIDTDSQIKRPPNSNWYWLMITFTFNENLTVLVHVSTKGRYVLRKRSR